MIISITMNPSIDISYPLEKFNLDTTNRVVNVTKTAGGKGLNVTRVLKQAGADVLASGLLGGHLGAFIQAQLDQENIDHDFFEIGGETRNCIAILHQGKQTEILEQGPTISAEEAGDFLNYFEHLVAKADILSFSGSLPAGLPDDFYAQMIHLCKQKGKKVILDSSGNSLKAVLASTDKPLLIKPNTEELADLTGQKEIKSEQDLKKVLSLPLFEGVEWIVVSMGGEGAFAKHKDTFYRVTIPKIKVVNPVGSGDSTVAGLTQALAADKSDIEVLKNGNVLGMLNAQEPVTGHVNMKHYQKLFDSIEVKEV